MSFDRREVSPWADPPLDPLEQALLQKEEEAEAEQIDFVELPDSRKAAAKWVRRLVRFLGPGDRYLVYAHHVHGMTQTEIAAALGTTQPAVQSRLAKAVEHLRFAESLRTWNCTAARIRADLTPVVGESLAAYSVALWRERWSQASTARRLRLHPSTARVRLVALRAALKEHSDDPTIEPYAADLARIDEAKFRGSGSSQKGPHAVNFAAAGIK